MSRFKKGRGNKKSPSKGGKKTFEPDPHDIEIFQTFQLLQEEVEKPDANIYDPEEFYEFPIISVEWLKKLEEHTKGLGPYPEEVVNEDLLDENKHNGHDKVFRWGPKRKHYNCILKSKLKFKKDYVICPEAAWQTIKENYPSTEIYRKFYVEKNSFHQMSVDYESVQVVFVDNCERVEDLEKSLQVYHVQYNSDDKFLWLVDYLNYLHFDDYEKDKFSYYRVDNRLSSQELRGGLLAEIEEKKDQKGPELEFRGYSLQHLVDQEDRVYFTDMFYGRSILLVVRNEHSQPFTLKPLALDLQNEPEICEYCDEREILKIACPCKQAFYCSIRCRIKNMNYHKKTCPHAYEIEPLYELLPELKKRDEFNYETGLINVGNSCYMASVIQILRLYPDFYEQIRGINHEDMVTLNREKLNVYPYLEEAVNRMNWSDDQTYTPHLLKAAIGIKNTNFVRFNQNDAMEFFQSLMEIINEDGKQIGQVNPIEKAMTSGQTFNYIICKDCKSEHKNVEEWTSLCVPIPEAIPTRKVGIEFLPYSLEKPKETLIYTFNKDSSTADDCLEFISETTNIRKDRLVLCLGKNDEIKRIIPPGSSDLMSAIIEDLNGPKYVHCRLLCFEVKLSQADDGLQLDDYVPVVLKYEKTLKSINDYLSQIVKTGSISLLLVQKNHPDSQIYSQITDLFSNVLAAENLELLSREYSDNLLAKPALLEAQKPTQGGTPSSSLSSKENTVKKDGGKLQNHSPIVHSDPKEPKGQPQKQGQNQGKQGQAKPKVTETSMEEKSTAASTSDRPKEEVFTFHDLLNEVILGFISPASAANSQLLADKPDLKEELAPLAARPQQLSLRYSNGHKLKCLNCQKPNYHLCKVSSSSASRLEDLYRQLRDGKVSEQPAVAVPLSVLVSDEQALAILEQRALSDDGGRGIQLKSNIDINYCLETMQKKEDMGKDSLVDCSKCGKKTEREICYIIEKAPKLFLIQLKRFKTDIDYKSGTIEKRKVCTMIELKETLAIKDQQFELFGVVNHYGEIDKGHYTACVKRPSDHQWFLYDDEKVTKITFKEVNSEGAYLLFYQLKTINP